MYRSVQINDFSYTAYIADRDIQAYKEKIHKAYLEPLKAYLLDDSNEIFSADKIQEKLFPEIKDNDVFLSHAHADEEEIIKLAIYLEKYGLNVFVDSLVWGNAHDLLRAIDNEYCWQKSSKTYNYNQRNHTTANVYMILNTALHKMIDQSELFLFLGSETAVKVKDVVINSPNKESVRSPWIYSELMFANQVHRREKNRIQVAMESHTASRIDIATDGDLLKLIEFNYSKPNLDYSLSLIDFKEWLEAIPCINKDILDNLQRIRTEAILDSFYQKLIDHGIPRSYNN